MPRDGAITFLYRTGDDCASVVRSAGVMAAMLSRLIGYEMPSEDWKEIEINYCGKRIRGRYDVVGRQVTVVAWCGSKTAQLGILPAERLAKMLLRELAFVEDTK
jgi:hypothetical protein